jgi:hypothetical protein
MECFSVSGDADYLLRIVAPDLPAFSELMMKRVLRLPGVAQHQDQLIALQQGQADPRAAARPPDPAGPDSPAADPLFAGGGAVKLSTALAAAQSRPSG